MKKGLLTVLLASLVLVGCQNYDDQFDDLNAQISALKSQVDGLSSLSGQVSSLSGSISGLSSGVAAAQAAASAAGASADAATAAANGIDLTGLAASLATLQAEVDAVQASLATAATASAVAALQTEIDAIEADVDELLSTSNIYSTDVTVSSASTLDAALALGNKLNILNATATITVTAAMDQTKVQTLVNRMNTLTGNLVFNSSSTTETTFNNLTSAADITMNQKGGYQMKALTSADDITLNDQYEANISIVDLRALATVTTITTSGETDAGVQFDQATEVHLSKLTRYPGSQLTIITKKGATLDMPLLDDLSTLGVYEETNLTLNGPAAYTSSLMEDSDQSYTNVATVTVSGNIGDVTINAGVETLSITDGVTVTVAASADDLVTATIDMAADTDATLTAAQTLALRYDADGFVADDKGDLDLTTLANLKTLTVSGVAGDINIDQNPNLESVTITADAMDLYVVDNDNMTSVTVTGAKLGNVQVSDHADLAALTLNHTTSLRSSSTTAAEKSVTVNVNTNPSLASLTAGMDDVSGLLVYTNAALATVDFTGLADDGTEATAYAHIFNNNLTFDLVKDGYDAGTTYTLTDTGSTTGGGGIKTLKTWIQHVDGAVNATNGLYVFVDAVTKYEVQSTLNGLYTDTAVPSAPSVTTQATAFSNRTSIYAVAALEAAETTTTGSTVRETYSFAIPVIDNVLNAPETALIANEGITINVSSLSKTFVKGDTNAGSTVSTVSDLISYINGDTSWGSDLTITAVSGGYYRSNQTVNFTEALTGNPAQVSVTSSSSKLWYKLGSTHISGVITLSNSDKAADIAGALATAISSMKNTAQAYTYGAAYVTGGKIAITKRVSITGYPDDITTGVTSLPAISFVIDAAQTSTTLGLTSSATSNLASLSYAGASSGVFLSITQNDVPGMTIKLVNNNAGATTLSGSSVSSSLHTGATSGILGGIGYAVASRITGNTSPIVTSLVSGTHFIGPNTSYANVFADVSTASTSTSQAAAVTNR
ncbi:hypothetical protein OAP70_00500, partial [Flavobacteriaceae bacterium]|nr:hypothetical protein [Flavobacteriaceae bacterium]